MNSTKKTLGQLIKKHREKKGWSLAKLSAATNGAITPSYLSRIEQDKKENISLKIAVELAEALEFDINEIIQLYTDKQNNVQRDMYLTLRELLRSNDVIINDDVENPLFGSIKLKDAMGELLTMIFQFSYKSDYTAISFSDLVKKIEEITLIIRETYVEDPSLKLRLGGVNYEVYKDEIFREQQFSNQIDDSKIIHLIKVNEEILAVKDGLITAESDKFSITLYKKGTSIRLIMFSNFVDYKQR